jgi:simple sugar transport system permease protein
MDKNKKRWMEFGFQVGGVVFALVFTTIVLIIAKAPPLKAFSEIIKGSLGSPVKLADLLVAFVPLLLVTSGLLFTFTAGLYNLGIEGQIIIGAIFTTGAYRLMLDSALPPALIIIIGFLAGALGGALWASLAGGLKTFGGVNEIFGGLGLNFVATAIIIWLIFGPWKQPGVGSMSGTVSFPEHMWLPMVPGFRLSWWSVFLAMAGIVVVYMLLKGTYFGLRLKAVGKNFHASFILGIPHTRYMMISFALCGAFAGLAGAVQVIGVYHRLIPAISSGYGFLGLLVAMLINYQALMAIPVALFFAGLNIGSIQLPIVLKLDSALSGVLQGSLVLFVVLMEGVRQRFMKKETGKDGD